MIGQHTQSSGLLDVWVECQLLGPNSAEQVLAGKAYSRGLRAHKITFQAMWRILLPQLLDYAKDSDNEFANQLNNDNTEELVLILATNQFKTPLQSFLERYTTNVNCKFWWDYMQMVQLLLMFNRAQRDGLWELHLYSFQAMLPYFMRYDHINNSRWGTIYLNEMHQLPEPVKLEFMSGNFVVKGSESLFNQVDPDQSQEWLNGIGKVVGV